MPRFRRAFIEDVKTDQIQMISVLLAEVGMRVINVALAVHG